MKRSSWSAERVLTAGAGGGSGGGASAGGGRRGGRLQGLGEGEVHMDRSGPRRPGRPEHAPRLFDHPLRVAFVCDREAGECSHPAAVQFDLVDGLGGVPFEETGRAVGGDHH